MNSSRVLIALSTIALTAFLISCGKDDKPKPDDQVRLREASLNLTCATDRTNAPNTFDRPIVIQVSLDGFRADYMPEPGP